MARGCVYQSPSGAWTASWRVGSVHVVSRRVPTREEALELLAARDTTGKRTGAGCVQQHSQTRRYYATWYEQGTMVRSRHVDTHQEAEELLRARDSGGKRGGPHRSEKPGARTRQHSQTGRWYAEWRDSDGRRVRSRHVDTHREAVVLLVQRDDSGKRGGPHRPGARAKLKGEIEG